MRSLRVNCIYFGVIFFLLALVHTLHIAAIEGESLKALFIAYGLAQCAFETLILLLIGAAVSSLGRGYQWLFVFVTLLLLLLHLVDFPLVRLMDLPIWKALGLVASETWENFLEMLYSTHITLTKWVVAAASLALIVFAGLALYLFGERRKLAIPLRSVALACVCLPCGMLISDWVFQPLVPAQSWRAYEKALPWKRTLYSGNLPLLALGRSLKALPGQEELNTQIALVAKRAERHPDLFIFVIESLRSDYITPAFAPHLSRFSEEGVRARKNNASANGTQLSWFSAFYGKFPFYFAECRQAKGGSPALAILKQMGYEIEVFSAARLNYYKMDQLLFGKNLGLASSVHMYLPSETVPVYESDRQAMQGLVERVQEQTVRPRCYIIFLESTHFDYSFPPEEKTFSPFDEQINYLDLLISKRSLLSVQNRYRNAIHYIDGLMGQFFMALKQEGKWDEAVIAITGDHGEEFYEEGHLFHASNLNRMQIEVPLLFKLGARESGVVERVGSHIDLFPTLLHYMTGSDDFYSLFDGCSLLGAKKWPYTLTGRYNGSHNPYEFCIETTQKKLLMQFTRPLHEAQEIRLLDLRSAFDDPLELSLEEAQREFGAGFDHLLQSPAGRIVP
jgi:hypothetical protein